MSHRVAEIALFGLFGTGAGIYYAIRARDREERKHAMLLAAGGVDLFAFGYYLLVNFPIPTQSSEMVTKTVSCDVALNKLQEIRVSVQPTSDIRHLIDAVDTTCKNYLPWKDSFSQGAGSIDGISNSDMKSPVMWGIDPFDRFFVAMEYSCNKVQRSIVAVFPKVVAVFQSGTEEGNRNLISWGSVNVHHPHFPYGEMEKFII
ncbi:MAG: hypothetical protein KR126chlam3_01230 [Chlamydiae bacterium]|nr:hypothetical protein [Chlamydiota bacterium]